MKIRYYLRGLGIGIVVTALLMGFTKSGQKETLTDAEIVERAKSLGMVESSVLSADLGNKEEISVNDISEVNQQETMPETEPETANDTEQTEPETANDTEQTKPETVNDTEQTKPETVNNTKQTEPEKETEEDNPEKVETVKETEKTEEKITDSETVKSDQDNLAEKKYVVTIYSGDGSGTVAKRMEEMGVIEDAEEFDRYLCQNGYDKRLTTGNHEINAGADKKEMAEALVKRVD